MQQPTDRTVFQNAWVVPDVERACWQWVSDMGVGPFFVTEYRDVFEDMTYRGEPAQLDIERCRIQAPFTGRIESLNVDAGDRVGPGTVVLSLVDSSRVEIPVFRPPPGARGRPECGLHVDLRALPLPGERGRQGAG